MVKQLLHMTGQKKESTMQDDAWLFLIMMDNHTQLTVQLPYSLIKKMLAIF